MEFRREKILNELITSQFNGKVKVITGLRRSGKSYLLFTLFKNYLVASQKCKESNIIEIKVDEWDKADYRDPYKLGEYLDSKINKKNEKYYVFIDEVQMVEKVKNRNTNIGYIGFYDILNKLLNNKNIDVYVTGSNSKLLSSDIATEFRGRGYQIHVSPISFSELIEVIPHNSRNELLESYVRYGGLPEVWKIDDGIKKEDYLKSLISETYILDLLERHNIKKQAIIKEILQYLASIVGCYASEKKILDTYKSNKVDINKVTLKNYLNYFEDCFMIKKALRYDTKGKRYLNTLAKYYFVDIGLRNAILNFNHFELHHLIENVIFNELIRRNFEVYVGNVTINVNHKRKTLEIDFVAMKSNRKYYIQVTDNINTLAKMQQEKNSLLQIHDGHPKIIITLEKQIKHIDDDGIIIMDVFEFLLNENSI